MITPDKTSIRVLKKKIAKRDSYEKKDSTLEES